jgi:hypothetical protein
VTPLERHCGWLLRAYPGWYRRERAGEMLDTLLEASPPGARWPSFRDARSLLMGGLRVRGPLAWCLSIPWALLGAAGAGYNFIFSEHVPDAATAEPLTSGWVGESDTIAVAAQLGTLALFLLAVPVLLAGLVRIYRGRLRAGLAAGLTAIAWAWMAGLELMYLLTADPAAVAWVVVLTIPVLVAGVVRLYQRRLRAAGVAAGLTAIAWAGTWMVGLALMYQVENWGPTAAPIYSGNCNVGAGCVLAGYRHAVVSREELAVLAGWLALGAALALILASTRYLRIRDIRAVSSA